MVIFLDFDGVLHGEGVEADGLFRCTPHLWTILRAVPEARVVFSTSWREKHPLDELVEFATFGGGEDLAGRFIGVTPAVPVLHGAGDYRRREIECLAWLEQNGMTRERWLALDDIAGWFTFPCPHLYLVHYESGLTATDAAAIIESQRQAQG